MRTVLLLTLSAFTAVAQTLPAEAAAVLSTYEKRALAIREKADRETQPHLDKAIAELQALQDLYCQQKKLDEAVAIRDRIRQLRNIQPDPGALHVSEADIGKTMLFEVTGTTSGAVWGTEVYTSDSNVGTAAVHQGLLKPGEKAVLRVKVIPGQASYLASTKNGVTSTTFGAWGVSFVLGRAASAPETPATPR
jgi:hypothetical protein